MAGEIADGMAYLAARKYVHRYGTYGCFCCFFFFALEDVSYLITVYLNVAYIWGTSLPRCFGSSVDWLCRRPLHGARVVVGVVREEGGEGEMDSWGVIVWERWSVVLVYCKQCMSVVIVTNPGFVSIGLWATRPRKIELWKIQNT